jgi:hypothetical protein
MSECWQSAGSRVKTLAALFQQRCMQEFRTCEVLVLIESPSGLLPEVLRPGLLRLGLAWRYA